MSRSSRECCSRRQAGRSVLLAVHHRLLRECLRVTVEKAGWAVVAEATNGNDALIQWAQSRPEVSVIDCFLQGPSCLQVIHSLQRAGRNPAAVLIVDPAQPEVMVEAIHAGASACLGMCCSASEMCEALEYVSMGRRWIWGGAPVGIARAWATGDPDGMAPAGRLTRSEQDVLRLLVAGESSKRIAAILRRSPRTVGFHRSNIMKKLGLHDLPSLTRFSIRCGLTPM